MFEDILWLLKDLEGGLDWVANNVLKGPLNDGIETARQPFPGRLVGHANDPLAVLEG